MKELYEDKPIQKNADDLYGRNRLVENIARVIASKLKNPHSSFTIGVYGAWGEGKTSVLNLLKEKFDNLENVYQCSFNPWMLLDQESILQEFFVVLQHSLNLNKVPQLIDKIKKYGGLTSYAINGIGYLLDSTFVPGVSVVTSSIAKRLDEVRNLLPEQKPLNEQKKEISAALQDGNTHIIVYIDDLDRLDRDEIRMVFRLIRQVADFDNVIYVVAMDVNKVAAAISSFYGDDVNDGYQFVEKIINFPVLLPQVNPKTLKIFANSQLESILDINQINNDEYEKLLKYLIQMFSTKREWVRYLNNLQIMIDLTNGEVNLYDLCLIEALRINIPSIDLLIYPKKELLCCSIETNNILSDEYQNIKKERKELMDKAVELLGDRKKDIAERILLQLFPEQLNGLNHDNVIHKKICASIYFDKYFIKEILNEYISDTEIDKVSNEFFSAELKSIVSWIDAQIDEYDIDETMRALEMMIVRQSTTVQKKSMACCIIKSLIYTQEVQRYSYTLFADGKGNGSCTKLMLIWFPNYVANDIPENPYGMVKADVGMIGELMNYILTNAPIAYCMNLLTNFRYLHETVLEKLSIEYFKDACYSFEKRLYEIGNTEFIKYSPFLQFSLFSFWQELDGERLRLFFHQLINDELIDFVNYVDRLEQEDILSEIIIQSSLLYKELFDFVENHNTIQETKAIKRIRTNYLQK